VDAGFHGWVGLGVELIKIDVLKGFWDKKNNLCYGIRLYILRAIKTFFLKREARQECRA